MLSRSALLLSLLSCGLADAATIAVQVDASADRRPVDPQIYGVNFAASSQLTGLGVTVNRHGGNATTRYNWQVDVSNRGYDYVFLNVADGDGTGLPANSSVNRMMADTLAAGAQPILTIGTIGWTPIANRNKRYGFAVSKYGPQLQVGGPYDQDGGNGRCNPAVNMTGYCVGGLIVDNDPSDTSFASGAQWTRDWVTHLKTRHGAAGSGGIRYYALDNEVMLWHDTHRDVHPQPATYDEIWQKTVEHATAIKQVDPGAKVFGPVTWGYCDLFTSAADQCMDGPDRAAHGGLPFVRWYLRQVCQYEQQHGVRLVDYLDLHYYPQGNGVVDFSHSFPDAGNPEVAARRLRSLKELYDPSWVAESWFADLGAAPPYYYSRPQFLRRVREWIAAECPDMKLAITEYNWGPDASPSAAVAQAEVLAIFAREGVDLATRWVAPVSGSRVERAFRLFLDYDGNGSRVEGHSVRAVSADVDRVGAYAVKLDGERLMVLLFNKDTVAHDAQMTLAAPLQGSWQWYRFDPDNDVSQVQTGNINGAFITLSGLPPRSANLLVLPSGDAPSRVFRDGFEGPP